MRLGLVVSVVMLFILFFEAQGIRFLENGFQYSSLDEHQRLSINVKTKKMVSARLLEVHEGRGDDGARFEDLCRDGLCLSGRITRKLLSKGSSGTSTSITSISNSSKKVHDHLKSKQQESSKTELIKGNNNGKLLVESKPISEHPEAVPDGVDDNRYPDIIDIAGMDYTTARRKSPIHN